MADSSCIVLRVTEGGLGLTEVEADDEVLFTLEDAGVDGENYYVTYDLITLVKPTADNYNEFSQLYNVICNSLTKAGFINEVTKLHVIRHQARRDALNDVPLILDESPYSDIGAAKCYGYIEGAQEACRVIYATNSMPE